MVSKEHLDEDVLERYAMNSLSDVEAELVEDHTSLCTHCMDRLDGAAVFVQTLRKALEENSAAETFSSKVARLFHSAPRIWVAGAVAAGGLFFYVERPVPLSAVATVVISGTRGTATSVHGAGPFDFEVFMPESGPRYHVELLDQSGAKSWEGDVAGQNGNLHVIVKQKVATGQYFLRVTELISKAVHDYGLNIQN